MDTVPLLLFLARNGLACALVLALAPAAGAQQSTGTRQATDTGELEIQTALGFAGSFTPGRWTPVSVSVRNGGADLSGRLELQTTHGDALTGQLFTMTQAQELQLGRDARKRIQFTVLLENPSRPLVLRISDGTRELARRSINLRRRFSHGPLILVLSRDADLDYLNDSSGDGLRVRYPRPERLPERWQGYDAVRAVVLHGVSLEHLSARQYEALRRWIASGGTLLVSGGANYSLLRTPRLADLLPATPNGLVEVTVPSAVGEVFGIPLAAPARFHVNRLGRVQGRVLHQLDGVPLVLERRDGHGKVIYLSFDITRAPFDRWPGMRVLWSRLLPVSPAAALPAYRDRGVEEDAVEALLDRRATPFPGHATVLYVLAFYLALLGTGARLRARGPWARWLLPWMTWASPAIVAPAAYLLFGPLLFPKGITVMAVSLLEPFPDSAYGSLELQLGLYANQAQPLSMDYLGAEPAFRARIRPGVDTASWTVSRDGGQHLKVDERRSYVLHGIEGRDVIPFKLTAAVVRGEAGPRVSLGNDTGRPLRDLWLLLDGQGYALGTLAAEAEIAREFNTATEAVELWPDAPWRVLEDSTNGSGEDFKSSRILLEQALVPAENGDFISPREALLIGYSTTPLRPAGAGWTMEELALVLMRIPLDAPAKGPQPGPGPGSNPG